MAKNEGKRVSARQLATQTIKELEEEIAYFKESTLFLLKEIESLKCQVQAFETIGTIEDFRILKEKSKAKNPIYSDFDDNGNGEIIPYKAMCPSCKNEFEFGSWNAEENHHCMCGQAIDWGRKD